MLLTGLLGEKNITLNLKHEINKKHLPMSCASLI